MPTLNPITGLPEEDHANLWQKLKEQLNNSMPNAPQVAPEAPRHRLNFVQPMELQATVPNLANPLFNPANFAKKPVAAPPQKAPDAGLPAPANVPAVPNSSQASSARSAAEKKIFELIDDPNAVGIPDQQSAVDDYKAKLQAYLSKRPDGGLATLNLKPLAALADAWGDGSNLAGAYTPPQTPQQFDQQALAAHAQMAQLQNGLSTQQNALLKEKLAGLVGVDKANKDSPYQAQINLRNDNMAHRATIREIKNNKQFNDLVTRNNQLTRAMSTYFGVPEKDRNKQLFDEFQMAFRKAIGADGTTTGVERAKTLMGSLKIDWNNFKQYVFGKVPNDPAAQKEFAGHMARLGQVVQQKLREQGLRTLKTTASGQAQVYAKPENHLMADALDELVQNRTDELQTWKMPEERNYEQMTDAELDAALKQKGLTK